MFDFLKKLGFSKTPSGETKSSDHDAKSLGFGIVMTPEEREEENQKNSLMLSLLENAIISSGYFVPTKIPELMSIIRGSTRPFARLSMDAAYAGDVLSKAEKQALGLNTRMKYTAAFVAFFNVTSLRTIEPKSTVANMQIDAFHRACRTFDLRKFKRLGFVKEVRIKAIDECRKSNKIKKKYRLDEAPELPLEGCDTLCLCYYEPIIPDKF